MKHPAQVDGVLFRVRIVHHQLDLRVLVQIVQVVSSVSLPEKGSVFVGIATLHYSMESAEL